MSDAKLSTFEKLRAMAMGIAVGFTVASLFALIDAATQYLKSH